MEFYSTLQPAATTFAFASVRFLFYGADPLKSLTKRCWWLIPTLARADMPPTSTTTASWTGDSTQSWTGKRSILLQPSTSKVVFLLPIRSHFVLLQPIRRQAVLLQYNQSEINHLCYNKSQVNFSY